MELARRLGLLQNVFSLQEENVQCKDVTAAVETVRFSESSEGFSGKLFGFYFLRNTEFFLIYRGSGGGL